MSGSHRELVLYCTLSLILLSALFAVAVKNTNLHFRGARIARAWDKTMEEVTLGYVRAYTKTFYLIFGD